MAISKANRFAVPANILLLNLRQKVTLAPASVNSAILPTGEVLRYNLNPGEVSEWFMVPLSKFASGCPKESFYIQSRTFVLADKRPF